ARRGGGTELCGGRRGDRHLGESGEGARAPRARRARGGAGEARGRRRGSARGGAMSCAHYAADLSAWIDRELPDARSADVAAHVASCAACRAQVDGLRRTDRELRAIPLRDLRPDAPRERWLERHPLVRERIERRQERRRLWESSRDDRAALRRDLGELGPDERRALRERIVALPPPERRALRERIDRYRSLDPAQQQ